jgi:hypothetical protein
MIKPCLRTFAREYYEQAMGQEIFAGFELTDMV